MTSDLRNKTALVTGGGRGLGRAMCAALGTAGLKVAVNYRANAAEAEVTVARIKAAAGEAIAVQGDVSDEGDVLAIHDRVTQAFGGIDVLVNNAGYARPTDLMDLDVQGFERTIRNNLTSSFMITQACLPGMQQAGWGRVIFISSTAAHNGGMVGVDYTASKAGMIGLMHAYARRLAPTGITVNAVAPALVIEAEGADAVRIADKPTGIPLERFGRPEEVAEAVMLLVRNGYMTGQTVSVNGGMYMT